MRPSVLASPAARRTAAWAVLAALVAIPVAVLALWFASYEARLDERRDLQASVTAMAEALNASQAQAAPRPRGGAANLTDPGRAETALIEDAGTVRAALERAGAVLQGSEPPARTRLGGVEEMRAVLTAHGSPQVLLAGLAEAAPVKSRVFALRMDMLPDGRQARLTLILVRAFAGGDDAS